MMTFLIDGYNLLHAMGVLHGRTGPTGLEKARAALLGLLRGAHGDEAAGITVVFDSNKTPPGATELQNYHGITVRFAIHEEEADDLIESLIHHDSAPRHLTVVSDDHRIQQAARRRHCTVLSCGDYLDWLTRHRRRRTHRPTDQPTKPEGVSREETQHWLREFAELADDPGLKELSDPFDFNEADE
jgi:predicted RNA-binding protein with PIN domain